jgi:hypothetical protein
MAWELVPAIGRQPSVSAYRLADEKILCEEFALQSQRYLDAEGFTDLEWLAIAHHYGLPTRLLSWAANPLLAAWFATGEENTTCEGKVLALRVPSVRRLKSVPAFGAPHHQAEGMFFSASRSAIAVAAFAASLRRCSIFRSGFGESGFSQAVAHLWL